MVVPITSGIIFVIYLPMFEIYTGEPMHEIKTRGTASSAQIWFGEDEWTDVATWMTGVEGLYDRFLLNGKF